MNYSHDDLGLLYRDDVDWNADDVSVPFVENLIGVSLAEGTEDGPSPAALSGYEWIQDNWSAVLSIIREQAFDFYSPYADAFDEVPNIGTPEDLSGTEKLEHLRIFSKDDFEVSLRFDWQVLGDGHEITFYIEDGRCHSHSVDG